MGFQAKGRGPLDMPRVVIHKEGLFGLDGEGGKDIGEQARFAFGFSEMIAVENPAEFLEKRLPRIEAIEPVGLVAEDDRVQPLFSKTANRTNHPGPQDEAAEDCLGQIPVFAPDAGLAAEQLPVGLFGGLAGDVAAGVDGLGGGVEERGRVKAVFLGYDPKPQGEPLFCQNAAVVEEDGGDGGRVWHGQPRARSRLTRSCMGGWVLNRLAMAPAESGLTMYIWAVAGLTSMG